MAHAGETNHTTKRTLTTMCDRRKQEGRWNLEVLVSCCCSKTQVDPPNISTMALVSDRARTAHETPKLQESSLNSYGRKEGETLGDVVGLLSRRG